MTAILLMASTASPGVIPFAFWNKCGIARATCLAHYNAGCTNDGSYDLLVAGAKVSTTCDMSTDGGGWTRLNSNLVTSTSPTIDASDTISGTNKGQGCGGTLNNFTVTGTKISFTESKVIFTRTTTIMQCPYVVENTSGSSYYLNSGTWTSHPSVCDWSNPPWANADNNASGLKPTWKVMTTGTATTFHFRSVCSDSTDNGAYTAQVFVR